MQILITSLTVLALVAALFGLTTHLRGGSNKPVEPQSSCATCTGAAETCPQQCALEAAVKPIEYFDDEELDQYQGCDATEYTDAEVEEFAQVLYTMQTNEVEDWCNSLERRNIQLPNQLKDEVYAIIAEQRNTQL